MEYNTNEHYLPSPSLEAVGQGGDDIGTKSRPHSGDPRVQNIEELLQYLASDQATLSAKAQEHLLTIVREKSASIKAGGQPATGGNGHRFDIGDEPMMQTMRPQFDDGMFRGANLKQTALLECPKSMVGRVIGKSGETIKALQQYTGAMIQIDQSTDPTRVTIAGSPQSLQLAISMVSDIIKGKFKGFAMLRQIATANELAQQHGGTGLGSHPVYVQGYGFMPPTQSVLTGYPNSSGGTSHEAEKHGMYSMQPLPQQRPMQYPTMQQHNQYLFNNNNTNLSGENHNIVLAKLMQLAAMEQQRDQRASLGDPFVSNSTIGNQADPSKTDFLASTSGLFSAFNDKGGDAGGPPTTSLF